MARQYAEFQRIDNNEAITKENHPLMKMGQRASG